MDRYENLRKVEKVRMKFYQKSERQVKRRNEKIGSSWQSYFWATKERVLWYELGSVVSLVLARTYLERGWQLVGRWCGCVPFCVFVVLGVGG